MIDRRRALLMKSSLPSGYTRVNYLKSSGTQYIDTGVILTSKFNVMVDYNGNSGSSYCAVFGSSTSGAYMYLISNTASRADSTIQIGWNSAWIPPAGTGLTSKNRVIVEIKNKKLFENGTFISDLTGADFTTRSNALIFRSPSNFASVTLYALTIVDKDGNMARNYAPAKRKSDGKPGLYDLCGSICPLTGTPFYINAGTGEFIAGDAI